MSADHAIVSCDLVASWPGGSPFSSTVVACVGCEADLYLSDDSRAFVCSQGFEPDPMCPACTVELLNVVPEKDVDVRVSPLGRALIEIWGREN
jgi:hypothetical protein